MCSPPLVVTVPSTVPPTHFCLWSPQLIVRNDCASHSTDTLRPPPHSNRITMIFVM